MLRVQRIKEIVIILLISSAIAFLVNFFSPNGISLFGNWDVEKGVVSAKAKSDTIEESIEIRDIRVAKKFFDSNDYLFVDARMESLYKVAHIKNSINFPSYRFDDYIDDFLDKYNINTKIITYCSGRECLDAHRLATFLKEEGYTNIKVFIDGFPLWEKKGFEIERSE